MGIALAEARPHYDKALQLGKKEGGSPAVLDEILNEDGLKAPRELPLGIQDISLDQIAGTKSEGRKNCFSKNFYPLMKQDTEFCGKWVALCRSHLEEGIHDPIKVYEYMNRYYVMEGNKRVSISKYFDSYSISADIIRIMPPLMDRPDILLYYEYLEFYSLSKINYIYFTKRQSFTKLQRLVGKARNESWTSDDRMNFDSVFTRFRMAYCKLMGNQDYQIISDAFLSFMTVFDYPTLREMSSHDMNVKIKKFEKEFKLMLTPAPSKLQMDPVNKKPNLLVNLLPKTLLKQKVAFIHDKSSERSGWTFQHDSGRRYIEKTFPEHISTTVYNDTDLSNIREILDQAIADKHDVIFTTSPIFLKETLRAAVEHPEIKFLNCTTHDSYKHVRTYYARMYEVNFLLGAIAGAMTSNDKVGYIAKYPIHGTVADINAFALGAKLINPRVKVHLKWTKQEITADGKPVTMEDIYDEFRRNNISIICDKDSPTEKVFSNRLGLYQESPSGEIWNLAMPIWNWSVFYEKTIFNIINGTWKSEASTEKDKGIHYWWGISSNLVNIVNSSRLPIGTIRLIELLKKQISQGDFNPFSGPLYSQDRIIQTDQNAILSPEQILTMNWLAENVIGEIPVRDKLTEEAKVVASFVGADDEEHVL